MQRRLPQHPTSWLGTWGSVLTLSSREEPKKSKHLPLAGLNVKRCSTSRPFPARQPSWAVDAHRLPGGYVPDASW